MEILITIAVIVLIFGLLVGIHEFGHFLAAKTCGVWVQEFAFGFGPNILRKKYKDTVYKINLIPLGGYVKLYGEKKLLKDNKFMRKFEKLDDRKEDLIKSWAEKYKLSKIHDEYKIFEKLTSIKELSEKEKDLLLNYELNQEYRINDSKRYSNKTIAQRALIISAGVIMNLILGIIVYFLYLGIVDQKVLLFNMADTKFVGSATKQINAPVFIEESNIEKPDIDYFSSPIIKANGVYIDNLQVFVAALENLDEPINIEYYKNGNLKSGLVGKELYTKFPQFSKLLTYAGKVGVGEIIADTPAASAGLPSDIILIRLAKQEIVDYDNFLEILSQNEGRKVELEYFNLETQNVESKSIELGVRGKDKLIFGAGGFYEYYPFSYFPSYYLDYSDNKILGGLLHSINITVYQFDVFRNIVRYSLETKDTTLLTESVGGPIKIGNEIGNLVKLGNFIDILNLTALISLSLAIMNLLPIPVVDGGHLLFLVIEKLRGAPLSDKIQGIFNTIGLIIIVTLSLLVTLKDILSLIFK